MRLHSLPRPLRTLLFALPVLAVSLALLAGIARGGVPSASALAAGHPAARSPLIVGMADGAVGWGGASTVPHLRRIKSVTGARWTRDPFRWNEIEPSPGRFDFAYYDHYMLAVARQGMHIVPQFEGSPPWAAPSFWAVPADPRAYAAFVAAVVRRYGPHGTLWRRHRRLAGSAITAVELWNEPYFANGNAGRYDPARYARLVKATSLAVHRVNRSVKVLLEADMATHEYPGHDFRWWVDSLYRAMPHLNRYFNGVAMHDYASDVVHLAPVRVGYPYPNFNRIRRIEDVRAQFLRHHASSKPFWIMETGFSTCTSGDPLCVSVPAQASDLQTLFGYVTGRYRPWVQAIFIYRLQDSNRGAGLYDGYGLLTADGTPKPALSVFKTFALSPH